MSEGVVRKIQPFTIGTRLSVPSETKCQEFVDVSLHRSAAPIKLQNNLRDQGSLFKAQYQPDIENAELPQVAGQFDALNSEGFLDERSKEDVNLLSSTVASRSIKKIAICQNAKVQDVPLCDSDLSLSIESMSETIQISDSRFHPKPPCMKMEDNFEKRSNTYTKVDSWFKEKHRCSDLGGPSKDQVFPSQNQQHDFQDIEYTLTQMTRHLVVKQDGPQLETRVLEPEHKKRDRKRLQQPDSNTIPSRETISQIWLRFQSVLKNYHQDLKLALDVSFYYQQADHIIYTISRKRSVQSGSDDQESCFYTEINNIASQILILNQTVSRLSALHPTLATRVTRKQAEVQKSWDLFLEAGRRWPRLPTESISQVSADNTSCPDDFTGKHCLESVRNNQTTSVNTCSQGCLPDFSVQLQKSTTSADKTLSWLKDNLAMANLSHQSANLGGSDVGSNVPAVVHWENDVSNKTELGLFNKEKSRLTKSQHQGDVKIENLFGQGETLWDVLRRRHKSIMTNANSSEIFNLEMDDNQEKDMDWPEEHMFECRAATENLEFGSVPDVIDPSGENDRGMKCLEQHECFDHSEVEEHSSLMLRINQLLSRCAELSVDIVDNETDLAVKCEPECSGLKGLQEQQDELEIDYKVIKEEMERLNKQLHLLTEKATTLWEDIQMTQQAWEELGWSMAENRCHLQQFQTLQHFLMSYLAMVSWTEDTQISISSEASTQQWRLAELPVPSELDSRIEQKFAEFEQLAAAGQKLMKEQHHLSDIIKERTEEMHSMLEWILVHWKAQKSHLGQMKSKDSRISNALNTDTVKLAEDQIQKLSCLADPNISFESLPMEYNMTVASQVKQPLPLQAMSSQLERSQNLQHVAGPLEIGHSKPNIANPVIVTPHTSSAMSVNSPSILLKEPCATVTPLGSSIKLILSFDQQPPEGSVQLERREAVETVHRVSTYLQVTDGSPVVEDAASPHFSDAAPVSTTSNTSATFTMPPQVSTVLLSNLPQNSSTSTLNQNVLMKRRKKSMHRHTVTGIVEKLKPKGVPTHAMRRARTWPMEGKKDNTTVEESSVNTEHQLFFKRNNVCVANSSGTSSIPTIQKHCFHGPVEMSNRKDNSLYGIFPLGSTVSFDLPTDWGHNLQMTAKGLNTESMPLEVNRDLASPNSPPLKCNSPLGYNTPGIEGNCQNLTLSPGEGHLEADGELDSPNGSHLNQFRPLGLSTTSLTDKDIGQTFTLSPEQESICKTGVIAGQSVPSLQLPKLECSNTLSQAHKVIDHTFTLSPKEEKRNETPRQDLPKASSESISVLVKHVSLPDKVGAKPKNLVHAAVNNNISTSTIGTHSEPKINVIVPVSIFDSNKQCPEQNCSSSIMHEDKCTENHNHSCISVHTKIRDLNGHIYFPSTKTQFNFPGDLRVAEVKSFSDVSEDSKRIGVCGSGRVIVCLEENCCLCSDIPEPIIPLAKETSPFSKTEPVHPDHWQFEEEEDELEDIWNGRDKERAP